jgi:O-antigen ligase
MADSVNPMLGIGPSNYVAYSRKYATVWYGEETYQYAHSNYAQMIAEIGWLGFIVFLWLIFAGIRTGIRSVRKVSRDIRWFTIGSTAIFIGIAFSSLVGDYLLPSRTNGGLNSFGTSVFVWLLLGASVSAVRLSGKHSDSKETEAVQEPAAEILR